MVWKLEKPTRDLFTEGGIIDFWLAPRDDIDKLKLQTFGPGHFSGQPKVWEVYITRADGGTHFFHVRFKSKRVRFGEDRPLARARRHQSSAYSSRLANLLVAIRRTALGVSR